MDISGVNSVNSVDAYSQTSAVQDTDTTAKKDDAAAKEAAKASKDTAAVVYEKSSESKKDKAATLYNKNAIISKLKSDQESRMASMQSLVEKLLSKQKDKYDTANIFGDKASNVKSIFAAAAQNADSATIAQAQKDIADDGYWGVEQTSDRLVDMAIALSGGDTSKADLMIDSIKKGFEQATKAWGDKLPDISQRTVDAAIEKLNKWKNGITGEDM